MSNTRIHTERAADGMLVTVEEGRQLPTRVLERLDVPFRRVSEDQGVVDVIDKWIAERITVSNPKFAMIDPIKWLDDQAQWEKTWKELFGK